MPFHRRMKDLADIDQGVVSREVFVNEDIYRQEQEQIFARAWLFIGHESQVPNPGDYFQSSMGEEAVILTRDREHKLHVFLNTCRHRGMKVCRYDAGNTAVFTCPYHGWSFATDGRLVGVPYYKEAYRQQLDMSQWGLVEVAQMVNYKGSIWASWDPGAPPFTDYMGGMIRYLDATLDCRDGRPGGAEVIGGVQKWVMPTNWKFPAENFSGDFYHNVSHRSVDLAGIGPSGKGRRDTEERQLAKKISTSFPDLGHGSLALYEPEEMPYFSVFQNNPVVDAYFRHAFEARKRRMGADARVQSLVGTVFPNMSYLSRQPRSISVWHPRGVGKTEGWRWYFVDHDAPQEVKDIVRHYAMRYSGPGGMTEQDDMENWNYASAASRGVIARRYAYNFEMGLGRREAHDGLPGTVVENVSEQNQRGFYRRWAELMDAEAFPLH